MERSWYWRVGLIVAVALFSVWQLVPSWFYFKLPPDLRKIVVDTGQAVQQKTQDWEVQFSKQLEADWKQLGGEVHTLSADDYAKMKTLLGDVGDEVNATFLLFRNSAISSARRATFAFTARSTSTPMARWIPPCRSRPRLRWCRAAGAQRGTD